LLQVASLETSGYILMLSKRPYTWNPQKLWNMSGEMQVIL